MCDQTVPICYLLCIKMLGGNCIHVLVRQRIAQLMHHFVHFGGLPVRKENVCKFGRTDGELQHMNNKPLSGVHEWQTALKAATR